MKKLTYQDLRNWAIDQCGEYYYGEYHNLYTMSLHWCINWTLGFIREMRKLGHEPEKIKDILIEHHLIKDLLFIYKHTGEDPKIVIKNLRRMEII